MQGKTASAGQPSSPGWCFVPAAENGKDPFANGSRAAACLPYGLSSRIPLQTLLRCHPSEARPALSGFFQPPNPCGFTWHGAAALLQRL